MDKLLENQGRASARPQDKHESTPSGGRFAITAFGLVAVAGLVLIAVAQTSSAQAIIDNGVIQLGVHREGHLNVDGGTPSCDGTDEVGLRYMPTGCEATAPGCLCEGWGVSYNDDTAGWASVDNCSSSSWQCISSNLQVNSFTATSSTAVSDVSFDDLQVTHDYHPSPATADMYEVTVTITNTGSSILDNVTYRRVMDWDAEPTPFDEYVTIVASDPPPTNLKYSSNAGFSSSNPLDLPDSLAYPDPDYYREGPPTAPSFYDFGPDDHGALFDFDFGSLAPGASIEFEIFYGAAADEAGADAAVGAVRAEVYSYGQTSDDPEGGTPNTFIFAFAGVGGSAVFGCDYLVDARAGDQQHQIEEPAQLGPDQRTVTVSQKGVGSVKVCPHLPSAVAAMVTNQTISDPVPAVDVPGLPTPGTGGNYGVSSTAYDFTDISTTGTEIPGADDRVRGPYPIGFDFSWYGEPADEFWVSTNGFIGMSDPRGEDGCCDGEALPTSDLDFGFIAAQWTDLCSDTRYCGGQMHYQVMGAAPLRILIVQFTNVPHCCDDPSDPDADPVTFQVKMFETTGNIEIHYQSALPGYGETTVGVQSNDGSLWTEYYYGSDRTFTSEAIIFRPS